MSRNEVVVDPEGFRKRLDWMLNELGVSRSAACKDLEIPYSTLTSAIRLKRLPSGDVIAKLTRYLGCTSDYLLFGDEPNETVTDDTVLEVTKLMLGLSAYQKAQILGMVKAVFLNSEATEIRRKSG